MKKKRLKVPENCGNSPHLPIGSGRLIVSSRSMADVNPQDSFDLALEHHKAGLYVGFPGGEVNRVEDAKLRHTLFDTVRRRSLQVFRTA
jgi:hypothetical protein